MSVTGPHFGLSVDIQRDALPRGTYFWQGHPWLAQLRHPCLIKPSEHQQTDQIASPEAPTIGYVIPLVRKKIKKRNSDIKNIWKRALNCSCFFAFEQHERGLWLKSV